MLFPHTRRDVTAVQAVRVLAQSYQCQQSPQEKFAGALEPNLREHVFTFRLERILAGPYKVSLQHFSFSSPILQCKLGYFKNLLLFLTERTMTDLSSGISFCL